VVKLILKVLPHSAEIGDTAKRYFFHILALKRKFQLAVKTQGVV